MASAAALSQFHFSRSFKAATGVSPQRYGIQRRLDAAKVMLRNAVVPIAIVAFSTGFVSQSHFSTSFKEYTGHTPGQYQNEIHDDMADMGDKRRRLGFESQDAEADTPAS